MTQRIIYSCLLFWSLHLSYAQEGTRNKIQLGPSLHASSFAYLFKDDFGITEFKGAINLHGGISSSYRMGQRFLIGSDLSFGSAHFKSVPNFSELSLLDNNDPFLIAIESELRKQMALNVNFHLSFLIIDQEKYTLFVGAGSTSLILLKQDDEIPDLVTGMGIVIPSTDKQFFYNEALFGGLLRLENRFKINRKVNLSLTPFAAYFFNRVHRNPRIEAKPVHLGVNAAVLIDLQT